MFTRKSDLTEQPGFTLLICKTGEAGKFGQDLLSPGPHLAPATSIKKKKPQDDLKVGLEVVTSTVE